MIIPLPYFLGFVSRSIYFRLNEGWYYLLALKLEWKYFHIPRNMILTICLLRIHILSPEVDSLFVGKDTLNKLIMIEQNKRGVWVQSSKYSVFKNNVNSYFKMMCNRIWSSKCYRQNWATCRLYLVHSPLAFIRELKTSGWLYILCQVANNFID